MEGKTKKERGEYPWAKKDALPSVAPSDQPAEILVEDEEEPAVEETEAPIEKPSIPKKKKVGRK